jgi:hypothetical protein
LSISDTESGRRDTTGVVVKTEECKQVMGRVLESLQAVMGDDTENILGQLGHIFDGTERTRHANGGIKHGQGSSGNYA